MWYDDLGKPVTPDGYCMWECGVRVERSDDENWILKTFAVQEGRVELTLHAVVDADGRMIAAVGTDPQTGRTTMHLREQVVADAISAICTRASECAERKSLYWDCPPHE